MSILDFFFPKKCVGCKKAGSYFCDNCVQQIKQSDLVCPMCEKPSIGGITHPICRRHFGLDGLWFLGVYEDPLRAAIKKLKYRYIKGFGPRLNEIILEYWVKNPPLFLDQIKKDRGEDWVIIPIPLHWQRKNWRGFNQAEIIGQDLSKRLGLSFFEALIRTKNTTPQAHLKSAERHKNIRGAFTLNPKFETVNSNVILVDDVWTTGSTLRECCYVLKKGGAKKVWALTIAR